MIESIKCLDYVNCQSGYILGEWGRCGYIPTSAKIKFVEAVVNIPNISKNELHKSRFLYETTYNRKQLATP